MQSGTTHTVQLPCTCTIVERKVLHCRVFMYNAERYHTHLPADLKVWKGRCCIALCLCIYRAAPHTPSGCLTHAAVCKKGRCCIAVCLCIMQSGTTHTFRLPCTCSSVERKVLEDAGSRAMWGLSILSRNTDALAAKIAAAIEANQGSAMLCVSWRVRHLRHASRSRSLAYLCGVGSDLWL